MSLTKEQIAKVQTALREKGFIGHNGRPLAVDGIWGANTSYAVRAYKRSVGLRDRDYVGPITYGRLTGEDSLSPSLPAVNKDAPPWYKEMIDMLGKHEGRDNAQLSAWLRSDGATVGDPSQIPWCGDAVETAIKNAFDGDIDVPSNPYLAANWNNWGQAVEPQLGSILVFWRGSPKSWKGHIGFYAGESSSNYYVLGGNQGNAITIAPLAKSRLRSGGSRWPLKGPKPKGIKVSMSGGVVSTNEA